MWPESSSYADLKKYRPLLTYAQNIKSCLKTGSNPRIKEQKRWQGGGGVPTFGSFVWQATSRSATGTSSWIWVSDMGDLSLYNS